MKSSISAYKKNSKKRILEDAFFHVPPENTEHGSWCVSYEANMSTETDCDIQEKPESELSWKRMIHWPKINIEIR
jgi:hypothetical protein